MAKDRLDTLLVTGGHFDSREKAKRAIMAGIVYIDEEKVDKPGQRYDIASNIIVRGKELAYVSRGGLKLEKAINEFNIELKGLICLDIGASTGGFTDCMLQNGATKVYAVDVGYGQLAWKLRSDQRVICMERTNFRYVTKEDIGENVDFASADVAFISLKKILIPAKAILKESGEMICLIKPQFEAGREKVGKKGVVKDPDVHIEVIHDICMFALDNNFKVLGVSYSPITGPEGNIEYLLHLKKCDQTNQVSTEEIERLVEEAHKKLLR